MSPYDGSHLRLFAAARPSELVAWERMERVDAPPPAAPADPAPTAPRRAFRLGALFRRPAR